MDQFVRLRGGPANGRVMRVDSSIRLIEIPARSAVEPTLAAALSPGSLPQHTVYYVRSETDPSEFYLVARTPEDQIPEILWRLGWPPKE